MLHIEHINNILQGMINEIIATSTLGSSENNIAQRSVLASIKDEDIISSMMEWVNVCYDEEDKDAFIATVDSLDVRYTLKIWAVGIKDEDEVYLRILLEQAKNNYLKVPGEPKGNHPYNLITQQYPGENKNG